MARPVPELSVVVAVVSGFKPAAHCVRSIEREAGPVAVEIIAVQSGFYDFGAGVTAVRVSPGCSEAAMRIIGRGAARGAKVAVVGDRYEVQPGWIQAAVSGARGSIFGCIDAPPVLSTGGWAIYLAEYAHLATPTASVPMGNVVYRDASPQFRYDPALRAMFANPPSLGEYAIQRFRWSRGWAQEHSRDWIFARRVPGALTRVALPVLLLWRRSRDVFSGRLHRGRFLPALPYLLVFGVIEAAGEISGFVFHTDPPECTQRF